MDPQMTSGNVAGGLTTLVEKALGANAKGSQVPIQGALEYGDLVPGPGRWIMDIPGHGFENLTGQQQGAHSSISSLQVEEHLTDIRFCLQSSFAGTRRLYAICADHIDFDCSSIIDEAETIEA